MVVVCCGAFLSIGLRNITRTTTTTTSTGEAAVGQVRRLGCCFGERWCICGGARGRGRRWLGSAFQSCIDVPPESCDKEDMTLVLCGGSLCWFLLMFWARSDAHGCGFPTQINFSSIDYTTCD